VLACYISGHGFGHAVRNIEVLNALGSRHPDIPVVVRTSAPRWLFDLTLTRPAAWQARECDTGVVQIDSLRVDERETIDRAIAFYDGLTELARIEADWLRRNDVRLVVGDIPPLAFAAAARAGVAAIALGNFTWDWIYEGYRASMPEGNRLTQSIRDAYRTAALALRLPMSGGFQMFREVVDLPFIARRTSRRPLEIRRALRLPEDVPVVLLSFGGYGLASLDLNRISKLRGYTVVTTADVSANRRADEPPGSHSATLPPNVQLVDERRLYADGLRYEDVVAAADIVVTKPGYGIISECIANDTAILYTSRGHFAEYDVLVREMPRWVRCGFIANEDLIGGNWQGALDDLSAQPAPPEQADVDGAKRAADLISELY
jgi:hypothetical protein